MHVQGFGLVQQSRSNLPVLTLTKVLTWSRLKVSSTALFLQRIFLLTEEPVFWWECVCSVRLVMDTSCWQPVCLVPCQHSSCQWWANCPASHLVDEWAASSSPGNFEEKHQQIFSKEKIHVSKFPVFKIPNQTSLSNPNIFQPVLEN